MEIIDDEADEEGVINKLFLQCEECGDITEINFEEEEHDHAKFRYVKTPKTVRIGSCHESENNHDRLENKMV